jgi:hypothetical protein
MTQFEGQGLALACFVAVIVAGGLALLGHLRAAAALNGALTVLFLVLAAPRIVSSTLAAVEARRSRLRAWLMTVSVMEKREVPNPCWYIQGNLMRVPL